MANAESPGSDQKITDEKAAKRRLNYLKMRLADMKDEMSKLKFEREELLISIGKSKGAPGGSNIRKKMLEDDGEDSDI